MHSFGAAFIHPTQGFIIMICNKLNLNREPSQFSSTSGTPVAHGTCAPAPEENVSRDFEYPVKGAYQAGIFHCAFSGIRGRGVTTISPLNPYFETGNYLHSDHPILI